MFHFYLNTISYLRCSTVCIALVILECFSPVLEFQNCFHYTLIKCPQMALHRAQFFPCCIFIVPSFPLKAVASNVVFSTADVPIILS